MGAGQQVPQTIFRLIQGKQSACPEGGASPRSGTRPGRAASPSRRPTQDIKPCNPSTFKCIVRLFWFIKYLGLPP